MIKRGQGFIELNFSNFSLGLNSKESQFGIKDGQAYIGSINAIFNAVGFKRAPGFFGLAETPPFTTYCKGLDTYSMADGTQRLMGVSDGKLYEVDVSNGGKTERYNITGTGEAYGTTAYNKYFVANNTGSCFVENQTGYQIGITPPAACTVAAAAGGSLPVGTYTIYVGYAVKVSGTNVLYSQGFQTANVTLTAGSQTIAFSNFANSSNTRVNNKVVWMAGPNDSGTVFFYHETGDNTTTSFNVSSAALYNSALTYMVWGLPSKVPPVLTGMFFHDDRIFGWKNNILHASMKAFSSSSSYDLERWPDIYYELPYQILSLFAIGTDLYINTNMGILRLKDADLESKYEIVTKRLFFKYVRTVAKLDDTTGNEKESPLIGLTNDGVRIFSESGFSIDLSKDIKNYIQIAMNDATSTFQPCGFVCRSNARSEYRLSFRDTDVNVSSNNRQLILNLDTLTIQSNTEYIAAWELWSVGFTHACIFANNIVYMAQSLNGNSQVMVENVDTTSDKWVYTDSTYVTVLTAKRCCVISKAVIIDIASRIRLTQARVLAQLNAEASLTMKMGDEFEILSKKAIPSTGGEVALFDEALFDEAVFSSEQPIITVMKLRENLKGSSCFIIYEQTAEDIVMEMTTIMVYGQEIKGHNI